MKLKRTTQVITGYFVKKVTPTKKNGYPLSRVFQVREAAEEFCRLAMKDKGPEDQIFVAEKIGWETLLEQ